MDQQVHAVHRLGMRRTQHDTVARRVFTQRLAVVAVELQVVGADGDAARVQVLGQDAADLAVADERDGPHQSTYRRPAAASGSRILYMSRPSTPEAS